MKFNVKCHECGKSEDLEISDAEICKIYVEEYYGYLEDIICQECLLKHRWEMSNSGIILCDKCKIKKKRV